MTTSKIRPQHGRAIAAHTKLGLHAMGGGLYLNVRAAAGGGLRKSWVYRSSTGGRSRKLGLGDALQIGLTEAREKAAQLSDAKASGRDPLVARDGVAGHMTYRAAVEAYLALHKGRLKNARHQLQLEKSLESFYPVMGDLDVEQIEPDHIVMGLAGDWLRIPETAQRTRNRVAKLFAYCIAKKYRRAANPADWQVIQHLVPDQKKPEPKHHAALPYAELPAFWRELQGEEALSARALQFAILTVGRTAEVVGALWSEIDFEEKTWEISAQRMKMARPHRVPLSTGAIAVLEPLFELRRGPYVFPSRIAGKRLNECAMVWLLSRMDYRLQFTVHGFRSTFRTWVRKTGSEFDNELSKLALAHIPTDKVDAAYMREDLLDERRPLMQRWDDLVRGPVVLNLPASAARLVSAA